MCLLGECENKEIKGEALITLKEALKLPKEEIEAFRTDLKKKLK